MTISTNAMAKGIPSALRVAFERSLTGLLFGLLVAFAIVVASVLEWRPAKLLQSWGSDIGLRLFADPSLAPYDGLMTARTPFVFVDLDREACAAFVGSARAAIECSDPSTPPPDIITALIRGLDESGATVVILDYNLPTPSVVSNEDARAQHVELRALLTADEGVPVIAPAPLDPVARVLSVVDQRVDRFVEGWSEGRLRLAAFVTLADPDAQDGIIRGVPAIVDVQRITDKTRLAYLPTAPFLAALIAEHQDGLDAADALFYDRPNVANCKALQAGEKSVIGRSAPFLFDYCTARQHVKSDRLLLKSQIFSIYSLSLPAAYQGGRLEVDQRLRDLEIERLRDLAAAYYGSGTVDGGMLYRRYRAKAFISDTGSIARLFDRRDLAGQIVVIGTSSYDAGDWHRTSLGAMAGAEIIINATRAFAEFRPLDTKQTFSAKLWQKVQLIFVAAFVLFFFIWAAEWLKARSWMRSPLSLSSWWHFPLAPVVVLVSPVVFLVGVGTAIAAVSSWTYWHHVIGSPVASFDFLLPVLAVAFEGVVEMSHGFLSNVHHWVAKRIDYVNTRTRTKCRGERNCSPGAPPPADTREGPPR